MRAVASAIVVLAGAILLAGGTIAGTLRRLNLVEDRTADFCFLAGVVVGGSGVIAFAASMLLPDSRQPPDRRPPPP